MLLLLQERVAQLPLEPPGVGELGLELGLVLEDLEGAERLQLVFLECFAFLAIRRLLPADRSRRPTARARTIAEPRSGGREGRFPAWCDSGADSMAVEIKEHGRVSCQIKLVET